MLFYTTDIKDGFARLEEEESRHLSTVLRRKIGDALSVTDGKGHFYTCELAEMGKKQALAKIISTQKIPPTRLNRIHMAVAPTKMMDRFEWFLEKATELGVDEITPLLCKRSERDTVRHDRMEKILVSAMKQSQRAYLPVLHPIIPFNRLIDNHIQEKKENSASTQGYLPWIDEQPQPHLKTVFDAARDALILIGPEGDFAPEEVKRAVEAGFRSVSLGPARLRTETAAVFVVAIAALA